MATGREYDRIARRIAYASRLQLVKTAPEQKKDQQKAAETEWPLKMMPDVYLKLHKGGKHAKLARQLVGPAVEEDAA